MQTAGRHPHEQAPIRLTSIVAPCIILELFAGKLHAYHKPTGRDVLTYEGERSDMLALFYLLGYQYNADSKRRLFTSRLISLADRISGAFSRVASKL